MVIGAVAMTFEAPAWGGVALKNLFAFTQRPGVISSLVYRLAHIAFWIILLTSIVEWYSEGDATRRENLGLKALFIGSALVAYLLFFLTGTVESFGYQYGAITVLFLLSPLSRAFPG